MPRHLVISPGPCTPNEAGISLAAISRFAGEIPIPGVCLGHQSLAQAFGARVVRARQVMQRQDISHPSQREGVFKGLNNPLRVTRYHSLVVEATSLPDCFEVTAWSEHADGSLDEIMGLRHKTLALEGVQFHRKAFERTGHQLLATFWPFPEKKLRCLSQNRHEAKKFPETLFTLLPVQIISLPTPLSRYAMRLPKISKAIEHCSI